jgi:hypothetical protein
MDEHEELLEAAKKAADAVFGDTSVPRSKTKESLNDLASHIQDQLDTLRND